MNNEHVFEVDITVYILVVVGTVGVVVVDTGGVVVPGGVVVVTKKCIDTIIGFL